MNSDNSQKRKRGSGISVSTDSKKRKLTNNQNFFDILPNEILIEIFEYISKIELVASVSKVSKRWQLIASSPLFWRTICIENELIDKDCVIDILRTAGMQLKELSLVDRPDCDLILKWVAHYNKNITLLSLTRCKGKLDTKFINSNIIKSVILKLNKLEALKMFDTNFRSVKFFEIFGSRKFIISRTKTGGVKGQAITYTGVLTFRQLEAYIKNANTNGRITLHDGKEYSIARIKEILRDGNYNPNAVVRSLDEFM